METGKTERIKTAFVKSIPILFSYIFVGMAYGIMMNEAGYAWYVALAISLFVYTGTFQFVLITFLVAKTSLATVALTALLMNSRQLFYGLSFVEDFSKMGKKKPYMIHTLTDETFAVNCSLDKNDPAYEDLLFYIALLSHFYWAIGTLLGAMVGQVLPFDTTGIDFCMTALFIVIFVSQWESMKDHRPALIGLASASLFLFLLGPTKFILPALLAVSLILVFMEKGEQVHE